MVTRTIEGKISALPAVLKDCVGFTNHYTFSELSIVSAVALPLSCNALRGERTSDCVVTCTWCTLAVVKCCVSNNL